jgi:hypothetical protein
LSDVIDELFRRAEGTGVDIGLATGIAALVLVENLAPDGGVGSAYVAVRIAGHVGQHMADGPARKKAVPSNLLVGQSCNGLDETVVGIRHSSNVGLGKDHDDKLLPASDNFRLLRLHPAGAAVIGELIPSLMQANDV